MATRDLRSSEAVSDEQEFTIGIEAGALVPDSLPWISVDLVSGKVKADGTEISLLNAAARDKIEKGDTKFEPNALFSVKEGDDILLRVTFERFGTPLDISLDAIRLVVKEFETDGVLVASTEAFEKQGVGSSANFLLHAQFESGALAGALSNYETAGGTVAFLLGEIEYIQINPETVGPETLVRSSATFPIRVERDIADNPPPY